MSRRGVFLSSSRGVGSSHVTSPDASKLKKVMLASLAMASSCSRNFVRLLRPVCLSKKRLDSARTSLLSRSRSIFSDASLQCSAYRFTVRPCSALGAGKVGARVGQASPRCVPRDARGCGERGIGGEGKEGGRGEGRQRGREAMAPVR
jgi:hypothetical protein